MDAQVMHTVRMHAWVSAFRAPLFQRGRGVLIFPIRLILGFA